MMFANMFGKISRPAASPINLACLPGSVVAVQLVATPFVGKPQLAVARYLADSVSATERLDHMARELHLARARLNILLEAPDYQFLQTEAPAVPAEELKTALRWQVKDVLRFPLDAVTLDVLPPSAEAPSGRRQNAFVVAAPNDLLRERMLQFRAYNSSVAAIDVAETAQRNLAERLEEHGRATAVLSITPSGCLLTASRAGELYFTRNFEVSTLSLAASASARRDQFDRLVLELQRSLDVLEHQFSFMSVSALWIAPFAQCEELLALLIENLYLPVKIINLAELFDCSRCQLPAEPDQQAALFHALGMALRDAEGAP